MDTRNRYRLADGSNASFGPEFRTELSPYHYVRQYVRDNNVPEGVVILLEDLPIGPKADEHVFNSCVYQFIVTDDHGSVSSIYDV